MITFCQMGMNRLSETKYCFEKYLPYVDQCIYVDGGSADDSIFYFRNWARQEPKIKFFLHPWKDDFCAQRNNYLKHVPDNTFALISDPDEWFTTETLEALPQLVTLAEQRGKDMIGFRCNSISFRGPEKVWQSEDNYWKRLLFKKYPGTRYVGNPHESLANHPHQIMDTHFIYEHVKQEDIIWHRGARNMFAGGGGPNLGAKNPRWVNLRNVCKQYGINSWHEMDAAMIKGNLPEAIKSIMYEFKDLDGWDGASEHRELWKTYYEIYHPEEKRFPDDKSH